MAITVQNWVAVDIYDDSILVLVHQYDIHAATFFSALGNLPNEHLPFYMNRIQIMQDIICLHDLEETLKQFRL